MLYLRSMLIAQGSPMTRFTRRIGIFLLAALFLAPAALAQGNMGQQQPPPPPEVDVSDDELETVASVFIEIQALQQSYMPRMQQAEDQEEAMQLRQEFQQEVTEKIDAEEDITPERFGNIMRAAQADSTLAERITTAVESVRQEEEGGGNR